MEDSWARCPEPSGQPGPDYWTYFAKRLVTLAAIPVGAAILDVGTFDGNVLLKAMKKADARGHGLGIDIDPDGLGDGVAEAINEGWRHVAFAQMDAAHLGLGSDTYDWVLANFVGWDYCFDFERMAFTAPDTRLAEIRRVLKPGGRVGLGFWVEQVDIEWMAGACKRYLPQAAAAAGKPVVCYAKEIPQGYEAILRRGGFRDISIRVETTTVICADVATWWRQMKQAARECFEEMPEVERFQEQIWADLGQFQTPEGIAFDKTVAYAFGTKP